MNKFVDDWEDLVATCAAHLQSARLILDDLARHPDSALEDALAYDLISRATCIALVSLDECRPTKRLLHGVCEGHLSNGPLSVSTQRRPQRWEFLRART